MDWMRLFRGHILDRGYEYFCDDAVEDMVISEDVNWRVIYRNRPAMMDELRRL